MESKTKAGPRAFRREDVAERLTVSLRKADQLILSKQIASFKSGKRRLVSEEALAAYIKKQEAAAR